jgi:hypothetical protein
MMDFLSGSCCSGTCARSFVAVDELSVRFILYASFLKPQIKSMFYSKLFSLCRAFEEMEGDQKPQYAGAIAAYDLVPTMA